MNAKITFADGTEAVTVEELNKIFSVEMDGGSKEFENFESLYISPASTYHFIGSNTVITKGDNISRVELN